MEKSLVLMFRAVLLGCVLVMNKAEDGALSFGPYHSSAGQDLFLNCVEESMI